MRSAVCQATSGLSVWARLRGLTGGLVSQGVEVATGLQSKFNWGDVAGGAVGAGVQEALLQEANGGRRGLRARFRNADITKAVSGVAGAIANAATRTLVNGTDFGDNLVATLPDAIGQTVGNGDCGRDR